MTRRPGAFQLGSLTVVAAAVAVSCVKAPYPQEMWLQHSPTLAALVAYTLLRHRYPLSDGSTACFAAFLLLHTLGARYIYSNVPYDRWFAGWTGETLSELFGWRRNHYDRLVHLAFGWLWVRPVHEVLSRHGAVPRRFAVYAAFEFVLAASALYEVFEWGLTMVMAPLDAEEYNGQQGDPWDAQKDIGLAFLGAIAGVLTTGVLRRAPHASPHHTRP